eukprot:3405313-Pyramimonas_sp.AAC.1
MYRASRRLSWVNVFSTAVFAGRGVLPGCGMAMFIFQLGVFAPLDNLYADAHFSRRHVYVHADDLTIVITAPLSHIIEHACVVFQGIVRGLQDGDL